MARKTAEITVETSEGPTKFTLLAMGGIDAGLMSIELSSVFGPAIIGIVKSMNGNDTESVVKAAATLTDKLGPAKFESMRKLLLRGAQCVMNREFTDVSDNVIDVLFSGHPGSLFKLLFEALKLNFSSFMKDLGVQMKTLAALKVPTNPA